MEPDELQDDPVQAALRKARAAKPQSADPVADILAKIRGPADPNAALHAAFKSGKLRRIVDAENAADKGNARDADAAESYTDRLGSVAIRAASMLPGGGTAMNVTRSLITGEPMGEAASANDRDAENAADSMVKNHMGVKIPEGVPLVGGSKITLADLPTAAVGFRALSRAAPGLGAVKGGAVYSGATRALNSHPDESVGDMAKGTALSALVGGAIPAATEAAGTLASRVGTRVRAARAPEYAKNINDRTAARDAQANVEYGDFRKGDPLPMTPALTRLIGGEGSDGLPIIRSAIKSAKGESAALMDLPDNHPAVLVEAHKIVGNKAWRKANGFAAGQSKDALLDAIDEAAQQSGNPELAGAVRNFATASRDISNVQTGRKALRQNASPSGVPDKDVGTTSLDALRRTSADRTAPNQQALEQGVLGELAKQPIFSRSSVPGFRWMPTGFSDAMKTAPDVIRASRGKSGTPLDAAIRTLSRDDSRPVSEGFNALLERLRGMDGGVDNPSDYVGPPSRGGAPGALPSGQYEMGNGAPRSIGAGRQPLQLKGSVLATPGENPAPLPAIPTGGIPSEGPLLETALRRLVNPEVPVSRRLVGGAKVTPKPMPASGEELLKQLISDAELRRRLGLSAPPFPERPAGLSWQTTPTTKGPR